MAFKPSPDDGYGIGDDCGTGGGVASSGVPVPRVCWSPLGIPLPKQLVDLLMVSVSPSH